MDTPLFRPSEVNDSINILASWVYLSAFIESAENALREGTSRADVGLRKEDAKKMVMQSSVASLPCFEHQFAFD